MKQLLLLSLMLNVVNNFRHGGDRSRCIGHVIGGVEVPIRMYPHVAQVISTYHVCGGSVISDRVIITAAHCLYIYDMDKQVDAKDVVVYLGSDVLIKGVKYIVCKVLLHERYHAKDEENFYYYDIGLVLLSSNIRFGPTNIDQASPNTKLNATRMYYVRTKTCNESQSYRDNMTVPKHMFCMIGQGWTGECFGDSGSGIIWKRYLVGLVSVARDVYCGSDTIPTMNTDVVYFRKWIKAKRIELESKSVEQCQSEEKGKQLLRSNIKIE